MTTNIATLEANRARLRAEQAQLREQVNAWREKIKQLEDERRRLLRQFDVGVDEAGEQAAQCLDDIDAHELAITRIEKQLGEYPDRIHQLNREIALAGHRDGLRELLQLRRDELAAFDACEDATRAFLTAYHKFQSARILRSAQADRLRLTAQEHKLAPIQDGNFEAPNERVFLLWLAEHPQTIDDRLADDFARYRRGIPALPG